MNMDLTPVLFSFLFGISLLQEIYQLTPQWSFLFISAHVFLCYKQIKMDMDFVAKQESISKTVTHHVKKIYSLSKYHASNIDISRQIPLIGLNEKEYEEEEKEQEYDDELHQSGYISPTPSLSTTSTTSSDSISFDGKVEQMIYLFESGQLFHYHANKKKPFIIERRFDYDPTATEWQNRTLMMKSKFI